MLPGLPVYDESAGEAGVVTAIAITRKAPATDLRAAAGLRREHGKGLPLEVIFTVPYKGMAIEGSYLPADGTTGGEALVSGNGIERQTLDGVVAPAGIPGRVLDERDVEHEASCELGQPAWLLRWEDVRLIAGEEPDAVIDRAYHRFVAIYRSVVEQATGVPAGGLPLVRARGSGSAMRRASAPRTRRRR